MTKRQFIEELQSALEGIVPPDVVRENVQYYENFIRNQMEMGKSEDEIFQELGNPRLIAKTIADAGEKDTVFAEQTYYDQNSEQMKEETHKKSRIYTLNSRSLKIGCFLAGVIFIVIMFLLFKIFFMFLGPILVIGLILYLIGRFRGR